MNCLLSTGEGLGLATLLLRSGASTTFHYTLGGCTALSTLRFTYVSVEMTLDFYAYCQGMDFYVMSDAVVGDLLAQQPSSTQSCPEPASHCVQRASHASSWCDDPQGDEINIVMQKSSPRPNCFPSTS